MGTRKPLIAGNWKMNLSLEEADGLVQAIAGDIGGSGVDTLVAPPFTALEKVRESIGGSSILLSAQNMHYEASGAYTGEISADMLLEAGCTHVILGHSERRTLFGETDEMIDKKAGVAVKKGLIPIICIGETLEEREQDRTFEVLESQLAGSLKNFKDAGNLPESTIIAYEPVWAIGTGKTATPEQAQEVHGHIRKWIGKEFGEAVAGAIRILYGGSVKPDNAKELMGKADIDGALVGGASLKPDLFIPIIKFQE